MVAALNKAREDVTCVSQRAPSVSESVCPAPQAEAAVPGRCRVSPRARLGATSTGGAFASSRRFRPQRGREELVAPVTLVSGACTTNHDDEQDVIQNDRQIFDTSTSS